MSVTYEPRIYRHDFNVAQWLEYWLTLRFFLHPVHDKLIWHLSLTMSGQNKSYWEHLPLLWKDSSSSQTFFIASSSAFTSVVPLSFTRTFLARSEKPLLTSQRGLSGSTRQPKNIIIDGTAAKPSINLTKGNRKNYWQHFLEITFGGIFNPRAVARLPMLCRHFNLSIHNSYSANSYFFTYQNANYTQRLKWTPKIPQTTIKPQKSLTGIFLPSLLPG